MELKTFDVSCVTTTRHVLTTVSMSKSGLIRFNRSACEKLSLEPGETVTFHQNLNEPTEWFIEIGVKTGLPTRAIAGNAVLAIQNIVIVRSVFESCHFFGKTGQMSIGETVKVGKKELVTLITAMLTK